MSIPRRNPAFTLLELLAVVTILGILAVLVLPRIGGQALMAKQKTCRQYIADINSAAERYRFEQGRRPGDLEALSDAGYYPAEIPVCPVDGSAYTLDHSTGRVSEHEH